MRWFIIAAVFVLAASSWWWWSQRLLAVPPIAHVLPPPAGVPPLPADLATAQGPVIAWNAHTQSRFEPCGCTAGMYGGLVRRAGLLARVPSERLLALELGGWSAGPLDYQVIKSGYYLQGLARVGIRAVAVGTSEVALGAPILSSLAASAQRSQVQLLAANVQGAAGILPALRIQVGGKEVLLTAVVPSQARGVGLTVTDPVDALLPVIATAGTASVVVMADLDEAGLAALARALPHVSLIIGGAVESPTPEPLAIGSVRVVHVANHGKTMGWWAWGSDRCRFELIHDTLPDNQELRTLVGEYQHKLRVTDLAVDHSLPGGGFVGDATCTACHTNAAEIHRVSRHAQAFASLERKNYQHDPECIRCHVTAFAQPGGYLRQQPKDWRASVSCESCHGPGQAHVAAAGRGSPLRPVGAATCARCHDAENSPQFKYDEYWKRIVHGR